MKELRNELMKAVKQISNNKKATPDEYRVLAEIAYAFIETYR